MAHHALYRSRYSAPCGKIRYPSKQDAQLALACCKGSPNELRAECRAYPCSLCDGWHLTSRGRADGIMRSLPELERMAGRAVRTAKGTCHSMNWTPAQARLFINVCLHALDGSGLPVKAWDDWWMWRAFRNHVQDRLGGESYEALRDRLRELTTLLAKARRLDPRGWATPQQTMMIACGWSEEQQAWNLPARLWVVAAATVV
ncbi:MAG: hypothetical protein UHD09_01870 [Bifidobacterium sp.]|nr:hypothetical protein [Bifidobacterium sp.]